VRGAATWAPVGTAVPAARGGTGLEAGRGGGAPGAEAPGELELGESSMKAGIMDVAEPCLGA